MKMSSMAGGLFWMHGTLLLHLVAIDAAMLTNSWETAAPMRAMMKKTERNFIWFIID